jgi:hypothetical protein
MRAVQKVTFICCRSRAELARAREHHKVFNNFRTSVSVSTNFSHTILCEIITARLRYLKFCRRWSWVCTNCGQWLCLWLSQNGTTKMVTYFSVVSYIVRSVLRNTKKTVVRYRTTDIHWWQCTSAFEYGRSQLGTARAFQLGVVWPPSLQPWSHSE